MPIFPFEFYDNVPDHQLAFTTQCAYKIEDGFIKITALSNPRPVLIYGGARVTGDNGSEFAYHEKISKELNTDFYFAHPYSSWERSLNKNTNGLVRQYCKKGSSFSDIDDKYLYNIIAKLNNRPRKLLDIKHRMKYLVS